MRSFPLTLAITAAALTLPLAARSQYVATDVSPPFPANGAYLLRGSNNQYAGTSITNGVYHAGTSQSGVWFDLNPPGCSFSWGVETYRGDTVGYAGFGPDHAVLWYGTTGTFVDLNPPGVGSSAAWGYQGREIVGVADGHAALWSGSAMTFSDLHPAGYYDSQIFATDGRFEVGETTTFAGVQHAGLWTGTAASFVDLHPVIADGSWANGTYKGTQVGVAVIGLGERAALWKGTAASYVDLHPIGAFRSNAYGISKNGIVGFYQPNNGGPLRACLFAGQFGFLDLHQFLPGYTSSVAYGIDLNGNISGYASLNGQTRAIVWKR